MDTWKKYDMNLMYPASSSAGCSRSSRELERHTPFLCTIQTAITVIAIAANGQNQRPSLQSQSGRHTVDASGCEKPCGHAPHSRPTRPPKQPSMLTHDSGSVQQYAGGQARKAA
jgi:hypothetical protein